MSARPRRAGRVRRTLCPYPALDRLRLHEASSEEHRKATWLPLMLIALTCALPVVIDVYWRVRLRRRIAENVL